MKRLRDRVPGWLRNPSMLFRQVVWFVLAVTVAGLVTLAFVAVLTSYQQSRDALAARDATSKAATARINQLQARIVDLDAGAQDRSMQLGELRTQVVALGEQVRQMGGKPIVVVTTTTTARVGSPVTSPTTTTVPPPTITPPTTTPSTTTTTTAPSTTTTTAARRCVVLGIPPGCTP